MLPQGYVFGNLTQSSGIGLAVTCQKDGEHAFWEFAINDGTEVKRVFSNEPVQPAKLTHFVGVFDGHVMRLLRVARNLKPRC